MNLSKDNKVLKNLKLKTNYDLTSKSSFLDIGSGFGKPVFHTVLKVGWYSHGIEIAPARVEFWIEFVKEITVDDINK